MGACWDFYLYSSLLDIRSLRLHQRGGQSGLGALPFVLMGEQGLPKRLEPRASPSLGGRHAHTRACHTGGLGPSVPPIVGSEAGWTGAEGGRG